MAKLKVIHVLYAGLGGHGNVIFPLMESSFGQQNENILVFFGIENVLPSYLETAKNLGLKTFSIHKKPKKYRIAFSQFKTILKEEVPDRIIVHSSELIVPAIRFRKTNATCKVFYVEHQSNDSKRFSLRFLSKYALKRANSVVCLSEAYANELQRHFAVKVPLAIIPNGINTAKFQPTNEKHDKTIIGMAARMTPGKDHSTLLRSFKKVLEEHPSAELQIAGAGETLEVTQTLCTELGLKQNVHFLGLLDEEQMLEFYKKLSIYVLATHYETLSTAILQAMACGLPVITSDIQNNKAVITHGENGWLYTDGDAEDLAKKMLFALDNTYQAAEIGSAACAHIQENYSLQKMADLYMELIK